MSPVSASAGVRRVPGRSFSATPASALASRAWFVVDATGKPLGRLASEVASVLRGKHKPTYTPHVDTGDFVIVINADKVVLTGNKLDQKHYYRHSASRVGFAPRATGTDEPQAGVSDREGREGHAAQVRLGREMLTKLKVYATPDHPARRAEAAAVDPQVLTVPFSPRARLWPRRPPTIAPTRPASARPPSPASG